MIVYLFTVNICSSSIQAITSGENGWGADTHRLSMQFAGCPSEKSHPKVILASKLLKFTNYYQDQRYRRDQQDLSCEAGVEWVGYN